MYTSKLPADNRRGAFCFSRQKGKDMQHLVRAVRIGVRMSEEDRLALENLRSSRNERYSETIRRLLLEAVRVEKRRQRRDDPGTLAALPR